MAGATPNEPTTGMGALIRRVVLFCLGAYLLIYALTVDAVQIGILVASLLLLGVISWDQIAESFGRDRHDEEVKSETN